MSEEIRSKGEITEQIRQFKMQKELSFSALDAVIVDKWVNILEWILKRRKEV